MKWTLELDESLIKIEKYILNWVFALMTNGEIIMPREDETEVILSTHIAEDENVITESDKSPAYTETQVNSEERDVTFWNRALWSDTTTNKDRKIKCEIEITGHGVNHEASVEHEYTSPLANKEMKPEHRFPVPSLGLSEYTFNVKMNWCLYEKNGATYDQLAYQYEGPHTATVDDTSIGG